MRIAVVLVSAVVLCLAGYGVAFQAPPPAERLPRMGYRSSPPAEAIRALPSKLSPPSGATPVRHYAAPSMRAPHATAPVPQQMAVVISKTGMRFFSPRSRDEIDQIELQGDDLLVVCDGAEVITEADGRPAIVCHAAEVVKTGDLVGKTSELRYRAGCLVLGGDESHSILTRNEGDEATLMLRAKTINIDLNTRQIQASDGSMIQLSSKPQAAPEASTPTLPSLPPNDE